MSCLAAFYYITICTTLYNEWAVTSLFYDKYVGQGPLYLILDVTVKQSIIWHMWVFNEYKL